MTSDSNTSLLLSVKPQHMTLTDAAGEAIQRAVLEGKFPPGSQLPPEIELMRLLGVSRTTLREALKRLEEQGLIVRRRGLGTYVRERPIVKDLSINFGISEMITQAGMTPGTLTSEVRRESAAGPVASALGIAEGETVVVVDRVRTADGRPVVWSLDYVPLALLGAQAIDAVPLESRSLYEVLNAQLQVRVVRGVAQLNPVLASADMAAKLGIRRGTPLMHLVQTDHDVADRPVLHSLEYHLPDAFVFVVNRKGPHW